MLPSFGSELRRLRLERGLDGEALLRAEPYLFANSPESFDRLDGLENDLDELRSVPAADLLRLERLSGARGTLTQLAAMPDRTLLRRQASEATLDTMSVALKRS